MLAPLDIENKSFGKAMMGYNKDDVDDFMELVLSDYEKLYKENIAMRDKINMLTEGIEHYKAMEDTMQSTLIVAQSASEEVKKNATEKADLIIEEAKAKSGEIIAHANAEIAKLTEEYENLKRSIDLFKAQVAGMFKAQIDVLTDKKDRE